MSPLDFSREELVLTEGEKMKNNKAKNDNKKWEQQYIPIKKISEMLNISQPTLRYYEQEKLISPIRDKESNYRKYNFYL